MAEEKRVQFNNDSLKLAYYQAVCRKNGIALPPDNNKQLLDLLNADQDLLETMAIGGSHDKFLRRVNELVDYTANLTGTRSDSYGSILLDLLGVNRKEDLIQGMILDGQKALARVGMEKISKLLKERIMTSDNTGYKLESIDGIDYKLVFFSKA